MCEKYKSWPWIDIVINICSAPTTLCIQQVSQTVVNKKQQTTSLVLIVTPVI